MANVIKKSTNKFSKGLVLDFSPENTKNEVLTHALNATLLTFNGNELSLQNDMGNGRVETAFLPEGYIPVGVCEYGGIIYIVSYNPLEDKSQIGCFPSPERNISQDELGVTFDTSFSWEDFQEYKHIESDTGQYVKDGQNYIIPTSYTDGVKRYERVPNGDLTQVSQKVLLRNSNLNPGDKFIVYANPQLLDEKLQDLKVNNNPQQHPIIALNVVSIEDSGKIVYLNNDVRKYTVGTTEYHILGRNNKDAFGKNTDIDSYRNVLSSGYSVFKEKTSGKLAILAELVMIDSYSVTHKIDPITDQYGNGIDGRFKVMISTDVSPYLTNDNYYTAPKLRYYYLKESQGKITGNLSETDEVEMFYNGEFNSSFSNLPIASLIDSNETLEGTLGNSGEFNFPKPDTYHGRLENFDQSKHNLNEAYALLSPTKFYRIDKDQVLIEDSQNVLKYNKAYFEIELGAIIYEYVPDGTREKFEINDTFNISYIYEIESSKDEYINVCRDTQYREEKLYVQEPNIQLANKEIIDNPNVEKFYQQTQDIYKKIQNIDEIPEGTVIWINTDSGYATYQGSLDPSVNYYTKEVVYKMVSGGYTLEDTSGSWFYYASSSIYREAEQDEIDQYWNFQLYEKTEEDPYYGCEFILYRKQSVVTTTETVKEEEVIKSLEEGKDVYYITTYRRVTNPEDYTGVHQLFMTVSKDVLTSPDKFLPDPTKNYISGYGKPDTNEFPKDDQMILKVFAEFIPKEPNPENVTDTLKYTDVKLAEIKIPQSFVDSNLDLPFKYSYTLEPCMNYGKLEHLQVSNTIDFSNLRNFDKSDFTTWKYRIDGNQLMLTFGADIYDTFEIDKVSGLFLEFYDWRGFAGSLEISGKRSYSGKFTKILHLDTIGALSNKKIKMLSETNGEFIESYNHNVNILEQPKTNPNEPSSYTLNGDTVVHDVEFGWRKVETDDQDNTVYKTLGEDNDCGVLYSNLIYGVKPYLIIQRETDIKIIKKPDLFLFTMPVYNDYYYSVDSFKRLMNPKVNLVLTYRLTDDSQVYPYQQDKSDAYAKIDNGYLVDTEAYQNDILTYLRGMSRLDSLNVKRYFRYEGTTKLQLEVGLLQDYEQYNLSCDPLINEKFTCKLELLNDEGESNTVLAKTKDNIEDPCNWDNNVNSTNHYFGFNSKTYFDDESYISNFSNYNFLEGRGTDAIELKYKYIVGFDSVINDIRKDTVQATAVCALYHQNDGVYNTNDFGIREEIYTEENEDTSEVSEYTLFLPEAMVYNSGSETEQLFGLCRMVNPKGDTMTDQCVSYSQYSGMVKYINIPGKLNAGNPLRDIVNNIGKLTFCQPHAHGLFASNSTSIDSATNNYTERYITKAWINQDIIKHPVYNMSVNTQNMMNSASEFISVTKHGTISVDGTAYTSFYGLTAPEIAKFNRCMLETMKGVYVYNPDYDNFPVRRGDVIVDDTQLQFTSNVITHSAKFDDGTDFNHFLKIGAIPVDVYLEQLNEYSDIAVKTTKPDCSGDDCEDWVNGIKFEPDFTYCGIDSDNKYLVSSLTYNIPVPQELYDDLQLDFSDSVIVRHSDGSCDFIQGTINKKSLYGWFTREDVHKLVELDITNYDINQSTGKLSVLDNGGKYETIEDNLKITLTDEEMDALLKGGTQKIKIERTMSNGQPITLDVKVTMPAGQGFEDLGYETSQYHRNTKDVRHWAYFWSFVNGYPNPVNINNKYYMQLEVSMDTPYHSVHTKNATMQIEMSHFGFDGGSNINFYYPDYDKTLSIDEVTGSDIRRITANKPYWKYESMGSSGWVWNTNSLQQYYGDLFDDYSLDETVYITNGQDRGKQLMVWGDPTDNYNGRIQATNTGFDLYYDPGFGDFDGPNIAILRFRIQDFTVKIQKYRGLAEFESDILPVKKTTYYSQFDSNGDYTIKYTLTGTNQTLVGSSLVLNDLLYYPEIDGHRLFVRDSMFRSNSSRFPILYRNNGSNNQDQNLNALRTYTGPCYNQQININDSDPEQVLYQNT